MNYAIQSETCLFPYLETTARKRTMKHSLIRVENGLALFKLGKQEYAVESGQAIWIPIECLSSLTFFPHTKITRVDFSVRLRDVFPHQAGFIKLSELSCAVLTRLETAQTEDEVYPHLLQVLKDEVKKFEPKLIMSELSSRLASWKPGVECNLSKEHILVLVIREAMKRQLSGVKTSRIIDDLFSGNKDQFEQLCLLVVGREF